MIVSRDLLAQDSSHVITSKRVLKYLYQESVRAKYLDKAMSINDSIILNQIDIINTKDSVIINRNEALDVCNEKVELHEIVEKRLSEQLKKRERQSKLFQLTTIVGVITSAIFIIK